MNISQRLLVTLATLVLPMQAAHAASAPENFLYTSSGNLAAAKTTLARSDIGGVQVVYNWKSLERAKGQYDFSAIEQDLAIAKGLNKKMFIQVQDRFFNPKALQYP